MSALRIALATGVDDPQLIIRKARRDHVCNVARLYARSGLENWKPAEGCSPIIATGDQYLEYLGEAAAFESGFRYCAACAVKHWPRHIVEAEQSWPPAAVDAIKRCLLVEVNGGELEHIASLLTPGDQALTILGALTKAGFDVRKVKQ